MTAVQKRELDRWPDVLIVSTKGKQSIASLLADGGALLNIVSCAVIDILVFLYKTWMVVSTLDPCSTLIINLVILDEIIAIYSQALVSLFNNQPFTRAPPRFIEDNFTRDVETVEQFCNQVCP